MKKEALSTGPRVSGTEFNQLKAELGELRDRYLSGWQLPGKYIVKLLEIANSGYWLRAAELQGPRWNDQNARAEAANFLKGGGVVDVSRMPPCARRSQNDRCRFAQKAELEGILTGVRLSGEIRNAIFWVFLAQTALMNVADRVEKHVTGLFSDREGMDWPRYQNICGFEENGVTVPTPSEGHIRRAAGGRFEFFRVAGVLGWSEEVCSRVERSLENTFSGKGGEVVVGLQKSLTCWQMWRNTSPVAGPIREQVAKGGDLALKKSLAILVKGSSKGVAGIWEEFRRFRENVMIRKKEEEAQEGRSGRGPNRRVKKWLLEKTGETDHSALIGKVLVYRRENNEPARRLIADIFLSPEGFPRFLLSQEGWRKKRLGFVVINWKNVNQDFSIEPLPTGERGKILTAANECLLQLSGKFKSPEVGRALRKFGFTPVGFRGLIAQKENRGGTCSFIGGAEVDSRLKVAGLGQEWDEIEKIIQNLEELAKKWRSVGRNS